MSKVLTQMELIEERSYLQADVKKYDDLQKQAIRKGDVSGATHYADLSNKCRLRINQINKSL